MIDQLPDQPQKGRGAVSNPTGRFEPETRITTDDGWDTHETGTPAPRTTVTDEVPRKIISRNQSPDVPFTQSINPYRGCEHGCVYCFARPTHAYMGLSPGLDFETRIFAKPNAADLLVKELRKPGYEPSTIVLGANTDPYQPAERQRRITREILTVLSAFNHTVGIVTKSALVLRDLDLLAPMAARGILSVGVSLTTLDNRIAAKMEPRAAAPHRRLETIAGLSGAGVPVTALVAPVIPFLTDSETEAILEAAQKAGARAAGYILLRLPLELKDLFAEWLRAHFPAAADHVLNRLRANRDGSLYVSEFGTRMRGSGTYADLLEQRFQLACRKFGLENRAEGDLGLDTSLFTVPPAIGDQLSLL